MDEKSPKATKAKQEKSLRFEIGKQMLILATSGFGLVAALAWNNLIQELVNSYIKKNLPMGSGLISLFIYAVLITFIAVFVTVQLSRFVKKLGIEIEEKK